MKTSFLLEKKWKGRYSKWARLHLMALAEGEEIGQGGKVLSIVLILANTFGLVGTQPVKFVEISSLIGATQVL